MRAILFRAKRQEPGDEGNGVWCYGDIVHMPNNQIILVNPRYWDYLDIMVSPADPLSQAFIGYVDTETVGQYTGHKDKNGTKIFEGDIVKRDFGEETIGVQYASVEYRDSINGFTMNPRNDWAFTEFEDCEVIGNIHDETKKNGGHERGGT